MARDDFSQATKDILAERAGHKCSNPNCNQLTIGAQKHDDGSINIGVAAHICAASKGGKRYNPSMTSEQRKSCDNGIWLCSNCAALIDRNESEYTVELLNGWKKASEMESHRQLSTRSNHETSPANNRQIFRLTCILRDLRTYIKWFPLFDTLPNPIFDLENFPLETDWERVLENSVEIVGVELSLELKLVLENSERLRKLMNDEKDRIHRTYRKATVGRIMDMGAVYYGNSLKAIVSNLKIHLTDDLLDKIEAEINAVL